MSLPDPARGAPAAAPAHRAADSAGALAAGRTIPEGLRETILRAASRAASMEAFVEAGARLSFADLDRRVRATAAALAGIGVRPGDAVVMQLPNWWEAAVLFLGTLAAGARVVPVVPIFRERELAHVLREIRPRVVALPASFRRTDHRDLLRRAIALGGPAPATVLVGRTGPDAPPRTAAGEVDLAEVVPSTTRAHPSPGAFPGASPGAAGPCGPPAGSDLRADPGELAVVVYTSGSTGAPKGVMHSHRTLDAELRSLPVAHGLGPGDRVLMPSPLGHVSGVVHGVLGPALLGTCAVFMERWDPAEALRLIEEERITFLVGAPTFLQEILAHPDASRRDLGSLRLCSSGGASVPPELMRLGRERVPGMVTKRSYGSSEFPTIATTTAADAALRGLDTEGRALPGVEIRITDESGAPRGVGEEGEIRARGPECFLGYVDASLDHEAFDADGYYRTGDLGILDADGYLRVTGRIKDIIIRKGEKISAREIEDLLAEHPAVAEVAVIPVADPASGERACACLRLRPGFRPPDLGSLAETLLARGLGSRKLPEQVHVVDDFPRTPSGKIHRRLLRELVERSPPSPGASA